MAELLISALLAVNCQLLSLTPEK